MLSEKIKKNSYFRLVKKFSQEDDGCGVQEQSPTFPVGSNMFLLVTDVIWELAEKNHERQVKIIAPQLTLNSGGSGKSTVVKQMRILHADQGLTPVDRQVISTITPIPVQIVILVIFVRHFLSLLFCHKTFLQASISTCRSNCLDSMAVRFCWIFMFYFRD